MAGLQRETGLPSAAAALLKRLRGGVAEKDVRCGMMRHRMILAGQRVKELKGNKGKCKVCGLDCLCSVAGSIQLREKTCGF